MKQPFEFIVFCCLFLGIAVYSDLKSRKIPNWLTVSAAVGGISYQAINQGLSCGLLFSLKGLLTGFAILVIPFLAGGMGGGDVKLHCALGCWLGVWGICNLSLYAALIGGIMVIVIIAGRKGSSGLKELFYETGIDLVMRKRPLVDEKSPGLPFSIPQAGGFFTYILLGTVI